MWYVGGLIVDSSRVGWFDHGRQSHVGVAAYNPSARYHHARIASRAAASRTRCLLVRRADRAIQTIRQRDDSCLGVSAVLLCPVSRATRRRLVIHRLLEGEAEELHGK